MVGEKGEGEVWWARREREKGGGGEDECSSDTHLRYNSYLNKGVSMNRFLKIFLEDRSFLQ